MTVLTTQDRIWQLERKLDRLITEHAQISDEMDRTAQELETTRLVQMSESSEMTVPRPMTFMRFDDEAAEVTTRV